VHHGPGRVPDAGSSHLPSFDLIGGVSQTLAEKMKSRPGYNINRVWAESGKAVTFLPQRVSSDNSLPETGAVVWFS
jgi:hypothetical protein